MGILKEFINENSPDLPPKKKKKRVRMKNLNPFRKRKYRMLDEYHTGSDGRSEQNPPSGDVKENAGDNRAQKQHRGARELLHVAWESLGSGKGSTAGHARGDMSRRNKSCRHGESTVCLIEDGPTAADSIDGNIGLKLPKSEQNTKQCQTSGSEVKPDTSDEILVIETAIPPTKKKKKSAKKKVKKAGLQTVKMLGQGLSNVAVSFQFFSPDAAVSAVVKDMAKMREDEYRNVMYATVAAT